MFPITMSFTVSTPAELAKLVAATGTQISVDAPQGVKKADPKPEKPAATQSAAAGPETQAAKTEPASASRSEGNATPAAASAAQPAATASSTTTEPTAAASGALDYDKDVKPAFLKLVQAKGRAAGRKIIDAFAPTKEKLSEAVTTPEQYAQALKLIAKEMA